MASHKQLLFRQNLINRGILLGCMLVAGYLFWADYNLYLKVREAHELRMTAHEELSYLASREKRLKDDISELSTERGKEKYLRSQFLVGKEGEHLIIISGLPQEKRESATSSSESTPWWSW